MRTGLTLAALLGGFVALAEEKDKPPARKISVTDLKVAFPTRPSGPTEPAVIASADDLAKSPVLKGAADDLKKKVDFAREKLVVFTWSGSSKDVVGPTTATAEGDKATVLFTFTPGESKGLKRHIVLYAVPKDAGVKVQGESKVPK